MISREFHAYFGAYNTQYVKIAKNATKNVWCSSLSQSEMALHSTGDSSVALNCKMGNEILATQF